MAFGDGAEIFPVPRDVEPMLARVPVLVIEAGHDLDIVGTWVLRMIVNPEFRRGMLVAEDMARLTRDRITHAGDAE